MDFFKSRIFQINKLFLCDKIYYYAKRMLQNESSVTKASNKTSFKKVQRGKRKSFGKDKWPTKIFADTAHSVLASQPSSAMHTVFPLANTRCANFSTTPWERCVAKSSLRIISGQFKINCTF